MNQIFYKKKIIKILIRLFLKKIETLLRLNNDIIQIENMEKKIQY